MMRMDPGREPDAGPRGANDCGAADFCIIVGFEDAERGDHAGGRGTRHDGVEIPGKLLTREVAVAV